MTTLLTRRLRFVLFAALLVGASASNAFASHFRSLTMWSRIPDPTKPNVVEVHIASAWRWSFFGSPGLGTVENVGTAAFAGNGTSTIVNLNMTVQQIFSAADYFIGSQVITFTFPASATPYTATVTVENCCRLSTLVDSNHDLNFKQTLSIPIDMSAAQPDNSPEINALPVYFVLNNTQNLIQLPTIDPDNDPVTFRVATTTESELATAKPAGLTLSSSGLIAFTPTETCTGGCAYALQVIATDGKGASVPFDFTLVGLTPQGPAPSLTINGSSTAPSVTVPVGSSVVVPVVAKPTYNPVGGVTLSAGLLPTGATVTPALPLVGTIPSGSNTTSASAVFTWTPTLDQIGTATAIFEAQDALGDVTDEPLTINVVNSQLLYMSGILRDFSPTTADFARPDGDNTISLVAAALGPNEKPVFHPSGASTTVAGAASFANWWSGTGQVFTQPLSNFGQTSSNVFDATVQNLAAGHQYFTYEVHSYFQYVPGMVLHYSSSDDMWIFINGQLAVDLGGVHATPRTATFNADGFAAAAGLTANGIYPMAIFYAHRGSSAADVASIKLETDNPALCNPIQGVAPVDLSTLTRLGAAQMNGGALRLVSTSSPSASDGVAWTPSPLAVNAGFEATFTFQMTHGAEGAAFVLQGQGATARGGDGSNLGYAGIPDSIAIEFDPHIDATLSDPSYEHVSIHTNFAQANSANESFSIGVSANTSGNGTGAPFAFDNGVVHTATVRYTPGGSVQNPIGFIQVYVDNNLAPAVAAPIADASVASIFPVGQAYVGFTSATDATTAATVTVSSFSFGAPAASSTTTGLVTQPATLIVGQTGAAVVTARDVCADRLFSGGATVAATLTKGSASTPVTVTDNLDGSYTLSYTPQLAGNWSLAVTLDGAAIVNSPFIVTVLGIQPTISVTGGTFTYDGQPHAATGTATGTGGIDLGALTFTYNGGSAVPVDAGTYTVVGSFDGNDTYSAGSATATLTISPATPTVSVPAATFTYDGTAHTSTGSVTGVGGAVIGTPTFTYDGSSTPPVNGGTYAVIGSFAGNQDYAPATSAPSTLTIAPATATVIVNSSEVTYDGAPHSVTAAVTGVGGSVIGTPALTYNGATQAPTDAGAYAVAAQFPGNQNYGAASGSGTLTIDQATPSVLVNPGTVTYDGAPHAATGAVTGVGGVVLGTPSFTYDGSSTPPIDAGSYAVVGSFPGSLDYAPAASAPATLTITPATPTVSVTGGTFTYDGTAHAATGSVTGIGGAVIAAPSFTYNGNSAAPADAGSYTVVGSFAGSQNYAAAASDPATLTIGQAAPTVNVTGGTFTYDGTPHAATGSVTGVGGAAIGAPTFTYNGDSAAPTDAGSYSVVGSFAGSQNYLPATSAAATLTIGQATPTVTVTGGTFTYDGTAHAATGSVVGVGGTVIGTPAFTYNGSSTAPTTAGTYSVVGSFGGNQNYAPVVSVPVTLTIGRASANLAWTTPAAIVYGTALGGTQLDATAGVPGSFSYAPTAGAVLAAGPHTLSVTFTPADATDYSGASTSVAIAVTHAPLTITAVSQSAVYGAGPGVLTATYSGFVNGDTAANLTTAATLSTSATALSHAGAYPISVGGATSANYAIAFVPGTLTVMPAPLTIQANNVSMIAGTAVPPLTATYTGFVNGDTPANLASPAILMTTATPASGAGTYPIVVSGAASPDYGITFVNGILTVFAPEQALQSIASTIAALPSGGASGSHAADASKALSRALDPSNWIDGGHLVTNKAMPVFDDIRQAFDALAAIANPSAAVLQAEANLVTAARELDVAIGADVTQGDADAAAGQFARAIEDYKQAWQRAER